MIPIATVASSSSSPRVGGSHGSSLQGYLQVVAGQGDVLQKSFVLVQQDKLCLYTDDPAKTQYLQPYAMYDLARVQLVEQGAFQRPKSFGVVTADRGLLEFTCPTNSIRSSWIKVISEGMGSSKQQGNLPQQTMQPSPTVLVHPLSVKRASFIRLPGQSAMNASTGPRSSQPQPSHPMQQTHTAPGNPTMMRTPVMQSSSAPSSSSSHPQPHQQIPQHHNHNHNQYQQPPQPPLQQQYNAAMFQSAGPQYAPQGPYAYQPQSYDGGYYNQSAGYPPQQSQQSQPLKTQHIAPANHSHPALVKPVTKKPLGPKPATAGK